MPSEARSDYPEVAAVVFAPGSTGTRASDVARAAYSQRYAVSDMDDESQALAETPSDVMKELALAAMVERTETVTLHGLDTTLDGVPIFAGIVGPERAVAGQLAITQISGGDARFDWLMPGQALPGEQVAVLVDRNSDHRCNDGDLGAMITVDGRAEISTGATDQPQAANLATVCAALNMDSPRF
jgi:hypothetical protein